MLGNPWVAPVKVLQVWHRIRFLINQFWGAVAFYTCLPIPHSWPLEFRGIARWAPLIGVLLGAILGVIDIGLAGVGMPILTRSVLVIVTWIALTGGLHLDGVMDTADGLAVPAEKRLAVMADSHTGAFGVIAAIAVLALKIAALSDLASHRMFALGAVAGWGRWGQLVAIIAYPYLKPTGKGAFHKQTLGSSWDLLPSTLLLLSWSLLPLLWQPANWLWVVGSLGGSAIAGMTGAWLNYKLAGHTGDSYGAVVEWTEALSLCCLASLQHWEKI